MPQQSIRLEATLPTSLSVEAIAFALRANWAASNASPTTAVVVVEAALPVSGRSYGQFGIGHKAPEAPGAPRVGNDHPVQTEAAQTRDHRQTLV